jgi:hypothetical protein
MAKSSPDAGLLQGFAEKDNCTFGQDAQTRSRMSERSGVRIGGSRGCDFELVSRTAEAGAAREDRNLTSHPIMPDTSGT